MRVLRVAFVALLLGCAETNRNSAVEEIAIQVSLNKPVKDIVGHAWPETGETRMEFTAIEHQHSLTVVFPTSRKWTSPSQLTFLSQEDGILLEVVVTPLRTATTFSSALSNLRETADTLGVSQDKTVVERIGDWSRVPPTWSPFASKPLGCEVEHGIAFFAEIKPSPEDGKWYLSYSFTVVDQTGVIISSKDYEHGAPSISGVQIGVLPHLK